MPELALLKYLTPTLGVWVLVLIAFITLVKVWPALRQMTISEAAQLRKDRRADFSALKQDMELLKLDNENMKARMAMTNQHSAAVTVRISQLEFVFRMVMDELEQISPGNDVARRAKELVAAMMPIPSLGDEEMQERVHVFTQTFGADEEETQ